MRINLVKIMREGLALYIILWLNGGMCDYLYFIPRIVLYAGFLLWLFLACLSEGYISKLITKGWPLYMLMIWNGISYLIFSNDMNTSNITVLMYLFVAFAMFLYYTYYQTAKQRKLILFTLIIDYAYIGFNTYFKLRDFPELARYLGAGPERFAEILELQRRAAVDISAIGSYAYFYGVIIVSLLSLYYCAKTKNFGKKLPAFIIYALVVVVSVKASFTLSIILLFVFSLLLLLNIRLKVVKKRMEVYSFIILLILVFWLTGVMSMFIEMIADLKVFSGVVQERMYEMAFFLEGNSSGQDSDLQVRLILYGRSLLAFFKNIAWGIVGQDNRGIIGGHSTAFDYLGLYGILGTSYYWFWFKQYQSIICVFGRDNQVFIKLGFQYFLFILLLNNISYAPIFVSVLIILPFGSEYVRDKLCNEATEKSHVPKSKYITT